jgi:photosystem II stability/assembly factor-like uncharacterized protein
MGEGSDALAQTDLVRLYGWRSPGRTDDLATTSAAWQGSAGVVRNPDYSFVRVEGEIFPPDLTQPPGTVALHSWWSPSREDNFITSDPAWAGSPGETRSPDYQYVRLEGYALATPADFAVPLYAWYSPSLSNNLATTDRAWAGGPGDTRSPDYYFVRIEGYVFNGITEFQPAVKWGGRAVAVTVDPSNPAVAVVASESGGLFKTINNGGYWFHIDTLPMFRMIDVQYAPSSPPGQRVVIATGWNDTRVTNRGGIWLSNDGGDTWRKPATSNPGCSSRANAFGIAFEPGTGNVYVGTDCGLAISRDFGETWTHVVPNLTSPMVLAVAAQSGGIVDVSGPGGHQRFTGSGATSCPVLTGPPTSEWVHGIAVSPLESAVVFIADRTGLFERRFLACGVSAIEKVNPDGYCEIASNCSGRSSWVATHPSRDGDPTHFDIYVGDGLKTWRQTCRAGSTPARGGWSRVGVDHADQNGMAFNPISRCAQYIVSDGGVHLATDEGELLHCGSNWRITGNGSNGFNALQIYDATGQIIRGVSGVGGHTDLYIGTQDNKLWASRDDGATWENPRRHEGFHIQVARYADSHSGDASTVTWTRCLPCENKRSDAHFGDAEDWNNPPGCFDDNPTLVAPRVYVQYTRPRSPCTDIATSTALNLKVLGGSWNTVATMPWQQALWPQGSTTGDDVTIYGAVFRSSSRIGITRFSGIRRDGSVSGTVQVSRADTNGLNRIGQYCMGEGTFVCPVVWAVDPNDPAHLIAADRGHEQMKISTNGGAIWRTNSVLTDLITSTNREFLFRSQTFPSNIGPFIQPHVIAFDPFYRNHILVGTEAAGIFRSTDGGTTWRLIPGSRRVTAATSFFFIENNARDPNNSALVSTYGRGLWKIVFPRSATTRPFRLGDTPYGNWTVSWIRNPMTGAPEANPPNAAHYRWLVVAGGSIKSIALAQDNTIGAIGTDTGQTVVSSTDGQPVALEPLGIDIVSNQPPGNYAGCPACDLIVQQGGVIKGLILDEGQVRSVIAGFGSLPGEADVLQFYPPPSKITPTPDETAPEGPYLWINTGVALPQPTAFPGGKVVLRGTGFESGPNATPVNLTLGERFIQATSVGANGDFNVEFEITERPGAYSLVASQIGSNNQVLETSLLLVVPIFENEAEEQPVIESIAIANGAAFIKFETEPGLSYTLESNQTLGSPNAWQSVQTIVGDGVEHTVTNQLNSTQGFYRLRVE